MRTPVWKAAPEGETPDGERRGDRCDLLIQGGEATNMVGVPGPPAIVEREP